MIILKNVKSINGTIETIEIPSEQFQEIDCCSQLTYFPALIDPHVHFRTPGHEYKENWLTASQAAISGGVTTVFDMPNNTPRIVDEKSFFDKKAIIDSQLSESKIPLRYGLWLGADKDHLSEIEKLKNAIVGIKIYMGSSTGGLLMDDDQDLEQVFKIAAINDLIVAVHAEDEALMKLREKQYAHEMNPKGHSMIRNRDVARIAVEKVINLSKKFGTKLYIVHVTTKDELELIRQAKNDELNVYAEVTPHHLYFTEDDYERLGTFIQTNPPVRTKEDVDALWKGLADGVIDTVGSDHAPHTVEEKMYPYGEAPSGVPGVEMILPLLLDAYHQGKISLEDLIRVTHTNPKQIFRLKSHFDCVLVDLNEVKQVLNTSVKSKCCWSPYEGMTIRGWPKVTIIEGRVYEV